MHLFVVMLLLGLALQQLGGSLGVLYDSGGVMSLLLFWLPLPLTFPLWIAHEVLSSFDLLRSIYVSKWVAVVFGLLLAMGFDYLLSILVGRARRSRGSAA